MTQAWSPVVFYRTGGDAPVVLVCEHASAAIPEAFGGLGLIADAAVSHAAWDIGALDVARGLADALDAPLVAGGVSRLLYDCNRPPTAPDCILPRSEVFAVPGNADLDAAARLQRQTLIHDVFHGAVQGLIAAQAARTGGPVALITVHSFTPVYHGQRRAVEIGFLHDADPALSIAAQRIEAARGRYRAELNAPYDATDGVTYSLARHAGAAGLPTTMIEIRNDLIDTPESAEAMAAHLADTLSQALAAIAAPAGAQR
ncbi:N-formylglutamate amidohydrolase [Actibacterium ureilyticum]|uniref:N-formylglutamate amidohydrolase n=1 Tax=Actibacterium ureilyticum TaxID=1590614 RepID=UPI000BAAC6FC|nr:N-formylglutamate amidohydrolase [Actibacterium ureilyticum]